MSEPEYELLPEGNLAPFVVTEDDIPMTETEAARLERRARSTPTPNEEN